MEHALISSDNPHIMQPHLLCAAYERPLEELDVRIFGPTFKSQVDHLVEAGLLRHQRGHWFLHPQVSYPAERVNIRSTSPDSYLVVEEDSGRVLETVEEASVFFQLHPGAVYLHQGEPYLIKELDREARIAAAIVTDGSYYTQPRDVTDIRIMQVHRNKTAGGVKVYLGQVEVTNQVIGFKKMKPFTEEVIGEEFLDLPPRRFNTVALWFDIPTAVLHRAHQLRLDLAGGLHASEHATIGVLPLFALCDRNDIGGVSTPLHPDTGKPQVFIYDGHPGGIGISEKGYELIEDLWRATLRTVSECPCEAGCPGCIQSPKCGNNNQPLDKGVAVDILGGLTSC